MDILRLKALQFFGRHGTEPWEKEIGRRYVIDIELHLDLTQASQTDSLRTAIDYRTVYARAREVLENESHHLIERIAGRLLEELFVAFPAVQAVRVRVAKPEAPIGGLNEAAEVEFFGTRAEWEAEKSA